MTNVFMFFEPKGSFRDVKVSSKRTARDFARALREMTEELYPEAEKIRLVMDNPNTHTPAAPSWVVF
jgi:hypothetical protein